MTANQLFMKTALMLLALVLCQFSFSQCKPVASYPFNGNANDVSGNNNHGVPDGETAKPVLTADRFGRPNSAYQFGGYYNKNWIRVPNSESLKFTSQMSVSLWFKQCTFAGMDGWGRYAANGNFILVSKAGDGIGADPGIWMFTYTDAQNVLHIQYSNTNGHPLNSLNFLEDATLNCFDECEWVHCVVVINNNLWQMYLNGQLRKQVTINPADFTKANAEDFYIGRMFGTAIIWYPFNGAIDDVNIYNCALTQSDVDSLYGNYHDPLSMNNNIVLDSAGTVSPTCGAPATGTISVFPNANNAPYQFSKDGGATFQSSGTFSNLSPGTYTIRIKSNCTQRDTVISIGKPVVQVDRSATICEGQTYFAGGAFQSLAGMYSDTVKTNLTCDTLLVTTLNVKARAHATFTQTICAGENYWGHTVTGMYIDTLVAANGCDSIRTLDLLVLQPTVTVIDKEICRGQSFEGYTAAGRYQDTFTSAAGCDSVRILNLAIADLLNPDLGPTQEICTGETIVLSPGNFSSYLWQDNSTAPQLEVSQPGTYAVSVTNSCGTAMSAVQITGKVCNSYFPTAFTPNNDGRNDVFKMLNAHGIKNYDLRIFNRWGQLVFHTNDVTKGWNGSYGAYVQGSAVFVWIASGVEATGKKFMRKGTVTLIR